MKFNFKNLFLVAIVLFTVVECKKKSEDPAPEEPVVTPPPSNPATVNTIAQVFADNGAQPVTKQVSASAAQSFTSTGLKIDVPANAFKYTNGSPVTSGAVDVTIKGILTKRDIILSGAPANGGSSNKLIQTKGCIKVSASQNGQTLRLNPNQNFFVNVMEPGFTPTNNLKKFIAPKVSTVDSTICWNPDPGDTLVSNYLDTLSGKYYYKARLDSANWLNVGQKWDTLAQKTAVKITTDSTFNKFNTAVYISLNGKLIVGALYEISPGLFRISNIPVGRAVHIVGIAVKNGQYYSAILPATITLGFNQSLNLQATTLSQIQTQLNSLP